MLNTTWKPPATNSDLDIPLETETAVIVGVLYLAVTVCVSRFPLVVSLSICPALIYGTI